MEWKELKIDNLPPDIFVKERYEFTSKYRMPEIWVISNLTTAKNMVGGLYTDTGPIYSYRKPGPKAPTHEEIMTKWWEMNNGEWINVLSYNKGFYHFYCVRHGFSKAVKKDWFTGRESADIPPEAT